jgi:hypothetical protein
VLYISARKFTQQYIESAKKNNTTLFTLSDYRCVNCRRYSVTLWEKQDTGCILPYFNHHSTPNGKPVILTSDKSRMIDIEQRLLSVLRGLRRIEPPRLRYLLHYKNKLYRDGVENARR